MRLTAPWSASASLRRCGKRPRAALPALGGNARWKTRRRPRRQTTLRCWARSSGAPRTRARRETASAPVIRSAVRARCSRTAPGSLPSFRSGPGAKSPFASRAQLLQRQPQVLPPCRKRARCGSSQPSLGASVTTSCATWSRTPRKRGQMGRMYTHYFALRSRTACSTWNTTLDSIAPLPISLDSLPPEDYTPGSRVLALYPDTSCFYFATVKGGGPHLGPGIARSKVRQRTLARQLLTAQLLKREGELLHAPYSLMFDDDGGDIKQVPAYLVVEHP